MNVKIVIIGVVIVALVAGVGLYARQNQDDTTPPRPFPSDPYEGWETYTNEEYGFSFKYPGDYILEKLLDEDDSEDNVLDWISVMDKRPFSTRLNLIFYDSLNISSVHEELDRRLYLLEGGGQVSTSSVVIGGILARLDEVRSFDADVEDFFSATAVLEKNDRVLEITFSTDLVEFNGTWEGAESIFQEFIDSFEFTQ
jgi:hypothetical protein